MTADTTTLPTPEQMLERVRAAYAKIMLRPCRGMWYHGAAVCCPLTAVALAEGRITQEQLDGEGRIGNLVLDALADVGDVEYRFAFHRRVDVGSPLEPEYLAAQSPSYVAGHDAGLLVHRALFGKPEA